MERKKGELDRCLAPILWNFFFATDVENKKAGILVPVFQPSLFFPVRIEHTRVEQTNDLPCNY
jgi:hypothetical protein